MPTPHQMRRTGTLHHDVEEWSCTACTRRLLLRRPPAFEQFVLDRGDECAAHTGGTGGLRPAGAQAYRTNPVSPSGHERAWLADQGITWEPDGNP